MLANVIIFAKKILSTKLFKIHLYRWRKCGKRNHAKEIIKTIINYIICKEFENRKQKNAMKTSSIKINITTKFHELYDFFPIMFQQVH